MIDIEFFVPGIPKPGGSKTATVIRKKGGEIVMKNGRPLTTTRDDAKGNADWKQDVKVFAAQAYHGIPLGCALRVEMTFTFSRPKSHYRKNGSLLPSAPNHKTTKPDVLKLARSTEDAMTGVIWVDDNCVIEQSLRKLYADRPGAMIRVSVLAQAGAR